MLEARRRSMLPAVCDATLDADSGAAGSSPGALLAHVPAPRAPGLPHRLRRAECEAPSVRQVTQLPEPAWAVALPSWSALAGGGGAGLGWGSRGGGACSRPRYWATGRSGLQHPGRLDRWLGALRGRAAALPSAADSGERPRRQRPGRSPPPRALRGPRIAALRARCHAREFSYGVKASVECACVAMRRRCMLQVGTSVPPSLRGGETRLFRAQS